MCVSMSPGQRLEFTPEGIPLVNSDKVISNSKRLSTVTMDLEEVDLDSVLQQLDPYLQSLIPGCVEVNHQGELVCSEQEFQNTNLDSATELDLSELQVTMSEEGGPLSPGNWEDYHCVIQPQQQQQQQQQAQIFSTSTAPWRPETRVTPGITNNFWQNSFATTQRSQGLTNPQQESQCVVIKKEGSAPYSQLHPTATPIKTEEKLPVSSCQFPRNRRESVDAPLQPQTQHEDKRERRKAQNRKAAAKLRIKKKKEEQELLIAFKREETRRKELETDIANLQQKYNRMEVCVRTHLASCPVFRAQMTELRQ